MSNNEQQRETIKAKGRVAFSVGQTLEDCPYQTNGPYGRKYRRIWIAGYIEARDSVVRELQPQEANT